MAGENFKNVDKYWGIWYSVLYGMQEMCWINFNMGCFEMCVFCDIVHFPLLINFNMGCFEMLINFNSAELVDMINFNMGCFEII